MLHIQTFVGGVLRGQAVIAAAGRSNAPLLVGGTGVVPNINKGSVGTATANRFQGAAAGDADDFIITVAQAVHRPVLVGTTIVRVLVNRRAIGDERLRNIRIQTAVEIDNIIG